MEGESSVTAAATTNGSATAATAAAAASTTNNRASISAGNNPRTCAFAMQLHYMLSELEDEGKDDIVSWLPHGRALKVHDRKRFEVEILPNWFQQSKIESFQRQLNMYGFQRLTRGRDRSAYYHELFLRGRPELVHGMKRTKIKGTKTRQPASVETEPDLWAMPMMPLLDKNRHRDRDRHRDSIPIMEIEETLSETLPLPPLAPTSCSSAVDPVTTNTRRSLRQQRRRHRHRNMVLVPPFGLPTPPPQPERRAQLVVVPTGLPARTIGFVVPTLVPTQTAAVVVGGITFLANLESRPRPPADAAAAAAAAASTLYTYPWMAASDILAAEFYQEQRNYADLLGANNYGNVNNNNNHAPLAAAQGIPANMLPYSSYSVVPVGFVHHAQS